MPKALLFFTLTTLFSLNVFGGNRSKYFSLYGQYNYYTDIKNHSDNEAKKLSDDFSIHLDIRLYRIFIMTLLGGQSLDSTRNFYGAGFKVDLPGFFMFGGSINDLIRRKKRRELNTSIYWNTFVISEKGHSADFVGNRLGFSADVMVSDFTFITLDLGLYSRRGDQYLAPSLGFGAEF